LAVAACSTGSDTEETAAGSDVSETTTLPATTTIPPTTTTTIPPTTTTTIAYDSVEDLQAQFDGLMAALAVCVPIVTDELAGFAPFEPDPDGAALVAECAGAAFDPSGFRFETEELRELDEEVSSLATAANRYVDASGIALSSGTPSRLVDVNEKVDALSLLLALWSEGDKPFDASGLDLLPLASLPEPSPMKVKVAYDRGHDAIVIPNWYAVGDNADAHFTDARWCGGRRYPVIADDGTEYGAGCTEALETEADPTKTVRGDGWYYVGDEIAAGSWRSRGPGDDCYWAVYDIDGDIMDNHFGPVTTTMRIRSNAYQVEIDDCGVWLYG
jgi:hypothetical protein